MIKTKLDEIGVSCGGEVLFFAVSIPRSLEGYRATQNLPNKELPEMMPGESHPRQLWQPGASR